jgi:transposase
MPKPACPHCSYTRFWKVRRGRRKCRRCRREWTPGLLSVGGVRVTPEELIACALAFVRFGTAARIREAGVGESRADALAFAFRRAMETEPLPVFAGEVELDETYIGGQRKNRRIHIRRLYPPKRGHGTEKTPIMGLYHRQSGRVWIMVMPRKCDWRAVLAEVSRRVAKGARVYTDGYQPYRNLPRLGYVHRWVDHNAGEYSRGRATTNGIEGFWGFMKRRMACIGGMRRDRLHLFASEMAWRYNHRKESDEQKAERLVKLALGL